MKFFINWLCCVGFLRLNFGSSSSAASSSNTYNTDKRLVVDSGIGVSADDSTVTLNVMDGGAIEQAFGFGNSALDTVDLNNAMTAEGFTQLIEAATDIFNTGQSLIGQTQKSVADAYSQASTDKNQTIDNRTIIVLAGAAAATAAFIYRKK